MNDANVPRTPLYDLSPCRARCACNLVFMTSSGHVAMLATNPPPAPAESKRHASEIKKSISVHPLSRGGASEVALDCFASRDMELKLTNHAIIWCPSCIGSHGPLAAGPGRLSTLVVAEIIRQCWKWGRTTSVQRAAMGNGHSAQRSLILAPFWVFCVYVSSHR